MCAMPNTNTDGILERIQKIVINHNATLLALYDSRSFDGSKEGYELLCHAIESTDSLIEKILSESVKPPLSLYQ
jgi:hypothetical protein